MIIRKSDWPYENIAGKSTKIFKMNVTGVVSNDAMLRQISQSVNI